MRGFPGRVVTHVGAARLVGILIEAPGREENGFGPVNLAGHDMFRHGDAS
jgi:hypothetical protein